MLQECPCGSGEFPYILRDARGIECGYVCDECKDIKKSTYRPEIWNDPNYDTFDETIEPID